MYTWYKRYLGTTFRQKANGKINTRTGSRSTMYFKSSNGGGPLGGASWWCGQSWFVSGGFGFLILQQSRLFRWYLDIIFKWLFVQYGNSIVFPPCSDPYVGPSLNKVNKTHPGF
jgi:hypothetical protein